MSYQRHSRTIIGGKSRNLGATNLLVSKKKGGITPRNLSLGQRVRANGRWDLTAVWLPPTGTFDMPPPTGYTIELQQMIVNAPALPIWTTFGPTTAETFSFSDLPEGVYKVRARTEFASSSSDWVESNVANAFINLSFDLSNTPHFHTLIGKGNSSSG